MLERRKARKGKELIDEQRQHQHYGTGFHFRTQNARNSGKLIRILQKRLVTNGQSQNYLDSMQWSTKISLYDKSTMC